MSPSFFLGIESSCDDCAVALIDSNRHILGEKIFSQSALHRAYGGVVPEIAARDHLKTLPKLVSELFAQSGLAPEALTGIAATTGPGLAGGLMVALTFARAFALSLDKPFFPVNHLEAHLLTVRFTNSLDFPYLTLLASGGHCQFLVAEAPGRYRLYGQTRDDAAGEAFDKVAFLLGLDYPGGPEIERLAEKGDASIFSLPRPLTDKPGCDLSFSGLKSAMRRHIESNPALCDKARADLAAAFQQAVSETLLLRSRSAMDLFRTDYPDSKPVFVFCGGVAANRFIRSQFDSHCKSRGFHFLSPPPALCGDNAVMVGWTGCEYYLAGLAALARDKIHPRWPLSDITCPSRETKRQKESA